MSPVLCLILLATSALLSGIIARRVTNARRRLSFFFATITLIYCIFMVSAQLYDLVHFAPLVPLAAPSPGALLQADLLSCMLLLPLFCASLASILYNHLFGRTTKARSRFPGYVMLFTFGSAGALLADRIGLLMLFWFLAVAAQMRLIKRGGNYPAGAKPVQKLSLLLVIAGISLTLGLLVIGLGIGHRQVSAIAQSPLALTPSWSSQIGLGLVLLGCSIATSMVPFRLSQKRVLSITPEILPLVCLVGFPLMAIQILLRLAPWWLASSGWGIALQVIGLTTFVLAARAALRHESQAVLVAALGNMTFASLFILLPLGTPLALFAIAVVLSTMVPLLAISLCLSAYSSAPTASERLAPLSSGHFAAGLWLGIVMLAVAVLLPSLQLALPAGLSASWLWATIALIILGLALATFGVARQSRSLRVASRFNTAILAAPLCLCLSVLVIALVFGSALQSSTAAYLAMFPTKAVAPAEVLTTLSATSIWGGTALGLALIGLPLLHRPAASPPPHRGMAS